MYYIKHNDSKINLGGADVFTTCVHCGAEFIVEDFLDLIAEGEIDVFSSRLYCTTCNQKHRAEEKAIADRYNIPAERVLSIVLSGMNSGLSREAALVGARLVLSDGNELFSMEDVAVAIGGTIEDVAKLIQENKIPHVSITPAPGFESLFK